MIAGTGRESTRATIAAARRAAALGADARLVRTPSFFRAQMPPAALVTHLHGGGGRAPVPVLLYNYPALTGVNSRPDTIARLAAHPNIVGMKETSTDGAQFAAFVDAAASSAFHRACGVGAWVLSGALRRRGRRDPGGGLRAARAVPAAAGARARGRHARGAVRCSSG